MHGRHVVCAARPGSATGRASVLKVVSPCSVKAVPSSGWCRIDHSASPVVLMCPPHGLGMGRRAGGSGRQGGVTEGRGRGWLTGVEWMAECM